MQPAVLLFSGFYSQRIVQRTFVRFPDSDISRFPVGPIFSGRGYDGADFWISTYGTHTSSYGKFRPAVLAVRGHFGGRFFGSEVRVQSGLRISADLAPVDAEILVDTHFHFTFPPPRSRSPGKSSELAFLLFRAFCEYRSLGTIVSSAEYRFPHHHPDLHRNIGIPAPSRLSIPPTVSSEVIRTFGAQV